MKITSNIDEFTKKLRSLPGNMRDEQAKALFASGEKIMAASKELVPVDTGALRASGHVQPPTIEGKTISVEVGYGGPSAPYAEYVENNLDAHHPVGQAKFLEIPVRAAKDEIEEAQREAIQRAKQNSGLK